MEAEKVLDSIKDWLRNRLENPYFASVLAVWLYTNRIEVFGLFNFNEGQTIQERLLWMQQRFANKEVWLFNFTLFDWHFKWAAFTGFSGIIWYSFIVGAVMMLFFKYALAFSEVIYEKIGQYAVSIRVWNKPLKWVSLEKFEIMFKQFEEEKKNLTLRNLSIEGELTTIKNDKVVALKKIEELNGEIFTLGHEKRDLADGIKKISEVNKEREVVALKAVDEIEKTIQEDDWHEKDKIKKKEAFQIFLDSENSQYFNKIIGYIENHEIIKDDYVPKEVKNFFTMLDLIELNGNLYVTTKKGNQYYRDYLLSKKDELKLPHKIKGVIGGTR
ncbi:MAG: hypothetical protein Q7W13_12670 [Bacteroidia bacterium]|nr:hypothetical protein [Bacteroidia bacterium]